jgi:hypothetical protein
MNKYQTVREPKNDASRNTAGHHHEPWTGDELDELCRNWDGTDETLEVIAYVLGRTIEACRQRYYVHIHASLASDLVRQPTTRQNGVVTPTFRAGWLIAKCDSCFISQDVFMDAKGVKLCERCDEEKS